MNTELTRRNMIEQQIRPWEVLDQDVLSLLAVVKREEFEAVKDMARLAREENEALKARLAALEAAVGVRLINRTTRRASFPGTRYPAGELSLLLYPEKIHRRFQVLRHRREALRGPGYLLGAGGVGLGELVDVRHRFHYFGHGGLLLLGGADDDGVGAEEGREDRGGQTDVLARHDLAHPVSVEGSAVHPVVGLGDEDQLNAQLLGVAHRAHDVLGATVLVVELKLQLGGEGRVNEVAERLERFRANDIDRLILTPVHPDKAEARHTLERMAVLAGQESPVA